MTRTSVAIAAIIVATAGMLRAGSRFLAPIEQQAFDARLGLRRDGGWPDDLVLVPIDDGAMESEGPWPWPRSKTAAFLDRVREAGARTLAVDLTFATTTSEEEDALLASSLDASFLAVGLARAGGNPESVARLSTRLLATEPPADLPAEAFVVPLARFLDAALGAGHIAVFPDADGRIRGHLPLLGIEGRDGSLPSLAVAAWARHRGVSLGDARWDRGRIHFPGRSLPAPRGTLLLDFVPDGADPRRVTASELLRGGPRLDGALAVIYVDSLYAPDLLPTPLSPSSPGGVVLATAIRTLDRGRVPVPIPPARAMALLLLPTAAGAVLLARRRPEVALAGSSIGTVAYLGAFLALAARDVFLPVAPFALVAVAGITATTAAARVASHERQRLLTLLHLAQSRASSSLTRAPTIAGTPEPAPLLDGSPLDEPVQIGRYRVHRPLGTGGMGAIFLAVDEDLRRPVALKVLRTSDRGSFRRFRREAEAVARIAHPNVVQIYEVGFDARAPYLVLEYMAGGTLDDLLADPDVDVPIPVERATRIIVSAARGLGAAHAAGIVHRDVKPSNLLLALRTGSEVKVADFGIATLTGDERLTVEGSFVGTVGYLSPEQGLGMQVDARTDLYSLAVTWYRLLTGTRAFRGTTAEMLRASATQSVPDPREVNRDVPAEIAALVLRLGAHDRRDRPADGRAAAAEIDAALQRMSMASP